MKWFRLILFIFITVICLVFALLSPWGSRLMLHTASSLVEPLTIEQSSGSLLSALTIHNLSYTETGTAVSVKTIKLDVDWSCLIAFEVCLNQIELDTISVKLASQNPAEPQPASSLQKITLPLPVHIKALTVANAKLVMADLVEIKWQHLQTALAMHRQLVVEHLQLVDTSIWLPASKVEAQPSAMDFQSIADFQYQPIDLPELFIPIDAQIKQLAIENIELKQADMRTALQRLDVNLSILDSQIQINQLNLQHEMGTLAINGNMSADYQHNFNISGHGTLPEQATPINFSGQFNGQLNALNYQLLIEGLYDAQVNFHADLSNPLLPLKAEFIWQPLNFTDAEKSFAIGAGTILLDGDLQGYTLTAQSSIKATDLPSLTMQLQAKATPAETILDSLTIKTLEGESRLKGKLTLTDKLFWQGLLELNDIQPGSFWSQFEGDINGQIENSATLLDNTLEVNISRLDLNGNWLGHNLQASGQGQYDSEQGINISHFDISNGDNYLTSHANLNSHHELNAKIDINASELSQLYPGLEGNIQLHSVVQGQLSQPAISIDGLLKQISYQQLSLQQGNINGQLLWHDERPVDLALQLKQLSFSGEPVDSLEVKVDGTGAQHNIAIALNSQSIQFDSKLTGALSDTNWQGLWHSGKFDSLWGNYSLDVPDTQILADWQAAHYQISPHCWKDSLAALCIEQASFKQQLAEFDIKGEHLELLQIISTYLPQLEKIKTDSKLFFSAQGSWQMDGKNLPQATLQAKLTPADVYLAKLPTSIALKEFQISASATATSLNTQLSVNTTELGQFNGQININDWSQARTLTGNLSIQDLALNPLLPLVPDLAELAGSISGQIELQGSLDTPLVYGSLGVRNVAIAGELLPARIQNWDQEVVFDGQKARLKGEFYLGKGKGVSQGYADWQQQPIGEMSLHGEAFELDYRNTIRATFSPDINLKVKADKVLLSGNLDVLKARITVKELPEDAYSPSDDAVIISDEPSEKEQTLPLELALKVNIDPQKQNDVKLSAFGLTTALRGSLDLNQSQNKFSGHGDMNLVDGRYQAYGQDLQIRKGEILFNGPMDQPILDIEAIREPAKTADEVIVGIRVTGQAESPRITVFSNPSMEESEMLSYLLQGRSMNSSGESPDDAMLAVALINAGIVGSENRINKIGRKLGIEDLSLDTSGSGEETQISVSGYIAPGVQLRYGVGVFDSASQVALRYQLMPQLYLEAVNGVNNALDLYYQFSLGSPQTNQKQPE